MRLCKNMIEETTGMLGCVIKYVYPKRYGARTNSDGYTLRNTVCLPKTQEDNFK